MPRSGPSFFRAVMQTVQRSMRTSAPSPWPIRFNNGSARNSMEGRHNLRPELYTLPPEFKVQDFRAVTSVCDYIGPLAFLGLSATAIAYITYLGNQPREVEILHAPIDVTAENRSAFIVSAKEYVRVGDKPKGDLSGEIVQDKDGRRYLKKGAPSLNGLLQEFLISDFLAMVRPGIQPESLIMQEIQPNGIARFYTLSRMYDKAIDLEAFIREGDWRAKIAKKPLIGFEVALAADNAFAKQQDTKLANFIVIETDDAYVVATIDHEKAGKSFLHFSNKLLFTTDIDSLVRGVHDLYPKDDSNHAGLAGDPRAKEFMDEARKFMKEENIIAFYHQLATANTKTITSMISSIDGHEGLITAIQTHQYFAQVTEVQASAIKFLYDHALAKAIRAEEPVDDEITSSIMCPR